MEFNSGFKGLIRHLVYVTLCKWRSNEHTRPPPTYRELEYIYTKKELCVKLVIYKNRTEMHGQQNIKSGLWVGGTGAWSVHRYSVQTDQFWFTSRHVTAQSVIFVRFGALS